MFEGALVALVTPMTETGAVDYSALKGLISWHLASGTQGLVVLGTTGEAATLLPSERTKIIQFVLDTVGGRLPVVVGTGSNATAESVAWTQEAEALGASAALVVTPYYNKPTQEGLFRHYEAIAEASALPLILYNNPTRTGCDLMPQTVRRLNEFDTILAIKDATGGSERLLAMKAAGCRLKFLSGDDATTLDFILHGGDGVISTTANILPRAISELCAAARAGNLERAHSIDSHVFPLYRALFLESNPIPVKWALEKMGRISSGIRLPLTPLDARYQGELSLAMRQVGLEFKLEEVK